MQVLGVFMNSYIEQKLTWFLTLLPTPQSQAEAKERIFFFWALTPVMIAQFFFPYAKLTSFINSHLIEISHLTFREPVSPVSIVLFIFYLLSTDTKRRRLNAFLLIAILAYTMMLVGTWLFHLKLYLAAAWGDNDVIRATIHFVFQIYFCYVLYRTSQAIYLSSLVDQESSFPIKNSRILLFIGAHVFIISKLAIIFFGLLPFVHKSGFIERTNPEADLLFYIYLAFLLTATYTMVRIRHRMTIVALSTYKITLLVIPVIAFILFGPSLSTADTWDCMGRHSGKIDLFLRLLRPLFFALMAAYLYWLANKVQKPLKELYQQNKPVING